MSLDKVDSHLLGSPACLDPDLGTFEGFFNLVRCGTFQQFGSYLWKKTREMFVKILPQFIFREGSLHQIWKSSGFALVESALS